MFKLTGYKVKAINAQIIDAGGSTILCEVNVRIMQNPHFQNVVLVFRCSEEQTDIRQHFCSTHHPRLWLGFLLKSSCSADAVDARPSLDPHS